jgi:hypothetical protein
MSSGIQVSLLICNTRSSPALTLVQQARRFSGAIISYLTRPTRQ